MDKSRPKILPPVLALGIGALFFLNLVSQLTTGYSCPWLGESSDRPGMSAVGLGIPCAPVGITDAHFWSMNIVSIFIAGAMFAYGVTNGEYFSDWLNDMRPTDDDNS